MNKTVSLALMVAGIALMIFGFSELNSFTSDISRMFTGAPTDRSIWMLVGGAALVIAGFAGLVTGSSKR